MSEEGSTPQQASTPATQSARSIGFEEFIEAASAAALRAIKAREEAKILPPIDIIIGLILHPGGISSEGQFTAPLEKGEAASSMTE
jgi:hypothetical protein